MTANELLKIVDQIVEQTLALKSQYIDQTDIPIDFVDVFAQNDEEYKELADVINTLGAVVQDTGTGYLYLLDEPLQTSAGPLKLVKIRKPDPERTERGDADFNTNYKDLKSRFLNQKGFELVVRPDFEMLRLSDPNFKVMVCFSSTPLSQRLNL